jgi:hypothetical protein
LWQLIYLKVILLGSRYQHTMFEVVIIDRGPSKWEWQLCHRNGGVVLGGVEKTRKAAKYAGERALFFILLIRPDIHDPPDTCDPPQAH